MVKLQWLQINKFRSVKPGTRLTFNPGYNVLLGQNGTGKTTLLKLVAAVVRSNFEELRDTDFDLQYALSSDTSSATIAVRHQQEPRVHPNAPEHLRPHVERPFSMALETGRTAPVFSAKMTFESKTVGTAIIEIQGPTGTLQITSGDKSHPLINFVLSSSTHELWVMIFEAMTAGPDFRVVLREMVPLFAESDAVRFDESLEYLTQFHKLEAQFVTVGGDDSYLQPTGPMPESLRNRLLVLARQEWGKALYSIGHDQLPFLQETVRLLDFESAEATIELQSSEQGVADIMELGNLRFLFTHRGGWRISEKYLSYGQKRMLAFLYYLATVPSVAVVDELVNGLHHRWIRACIEALGQRQVFLTSQNPLLLDCLPFDSSEQVRSTFILCRWDGEGAQARMAWENMSQEAAEDFFDSYKVGFQQVGELLQAKGLW
ncbi:AAA family ATPase [Hyalangium sp.]|uniref:AAA family ATPase n=1 Tax=Hyalangium sp. TaxID=2028555 RepID=UPI002D2F742E|nr:AAA family ATPase [Hyalangium sp.]HYH96594.1 AAA family ATPase [Hyalangium sp.]